MSIRARLASIFGVAMAAIVIAGLSLCATLQEMRLLQRRAEASYEDLTLHVALASHASHFMNDAVRIALGGAASLDLRKMAEAVARDLSAIESLKRGMIADPQLNEGPEQSAAELEHIHSMRESFGRIRAGVLEMSRMNRAKTSELHAKLVQLSEQEYRARFLPHLDAAVHDARRDVARSLDESQRLQVKVTVLAAAATGGAIVMLVVLLGRLLRSIDRGFSVLVEGSRRIAQGDLDLRLPDLGGHELGRMSEAFNEMAASLHTAQESRLRMEKLAAVGQLAASVGHDLRNPIGAVRNASYYLKKRLSGTEIGAEPRVAHFLSLIEKELLVCSKIIGNLLDFARERRPTMSACAIRPLVDDALSVVDAPAHVRFENEVSDTLPVPTLDRDQFRQVLVNLLQNAAEAVPADREGLVRVSAGWTSEGLTISVADNGTGIPEEMRGHLFEPLFSTKLKGTGLGLAISAGIVRRHGGTLDVESELGRGTTFIIRIPGHDAEAAERPSSAVVARDA